MRVRPSVRFAYRGAFLVGAIAALAACRDLSGFTTSPNDHYEGVVVDADFVRVGVDAGTSLCLTLDADRLQDAPGAISTNDGRFNATPLRPIPQIWHDPLSTLSFGEGRLKNLMYVAAAAATFGDGQSDDTLAVVSLMQSGGVEVRLIRGAPTVAAGPPAPGGDAGPEIAVFAIFPLSRKTGPCSF
jgi:hypothetical protein